MRWSTCNARCIPAEKQTEEQKAVVELMSQGWSAEKAAEAVGVDRRVVHQWIKQGLLTETITRSYQEYMRELRASSGWVRSEQAMKELLAWAKRERQRRGRGHNGNAKTAREGGGAKGVKGEKV
jgi:primosomal protein N'